MTPLPEFFLTNNSFYPPASSIVLSVNNIGLRLKLYLYLNIKNSNFTETTKFTSFTSLRPMAYSNYYITLSFIVNEFMDYEFLEILVFAQRINIDLTFNYHFSDNNPFLE